MEFNRHDIERIVHLVIAELMRLEKAADGSPPASPTPLECGNQTIVVLYAPVLRGLEEAWDQLRLLEKQGYHPIHILPSESLHLITPEKIKVELKVPSERIFIGRKAEFLGITPQVVVGATLSPTEAAKIALAQTDTLFSYLVFQTLWQGGTVVLAQDGVTEPTPRIVPGAVALARTIDAYLQKLGAYGVRLVAARDLASAVRALRLPDSAQGSWADRRRMVITAQEVEEAEKELVVGPDAIITPLAWDIARYRGISIRRE